MDPETNTSLIYLDYAATSPVDPRVIDAMRRALAVDGLFANPSSTHAAGRAARGIVEDARAQVAARVGAHPDEIIFTSGATEASNLALAGALAVMPPHRRHVVTSRIEHPSVLEVVRFLERRGACTATFVAPGEDGIVPVEAIAEAIRSDTGMVSLMHVNNETGAVQDIQALAKICRERDVVLHVDAAQSVGKLPVDLGAWGVDLCSLTAHKLNGPKGIGALYVRTGVSLEPLLHGGEQERGLRPGTLPGHQIVGMGEAFRLADPARDGSDFARLKARLWSGLSAIDGVRVNGPIAVSAPHILNVAFPGVDAESLRLAIRDVAVSAGSACMAASGEGSHVLSAMGLGPALANSSLRFSLGRFTAESDIDGAVSRVGTAVRQLRRLAASSPEWCRT